LGIGAVANLPLRARQYENGMTSMRLDIEGAAAASGVHNALVFVRESWGAQLVARLWARGISRPDAELFYRRIDACRLDQALVALETAEVKDAAAAAVLRPLLADSARLIGSPVSPDTTEQFLAGSQYARWCVDRINEDRRGFTLYPPLLLARGGNNLYARDLHGRDTLLLAEYPERPVFLLKPPGSGIGLSPKFYPASRDSIWAAARQGAVGPATSASSESTTRPGRSQSR
ncbi:MAG: hypothetical protein ACHQXA_06380, partial [Gemmatimonadales bacterium]